MMLSLLRVFCVRPLFYYSILYILLVCNNLDGKEGWLIYFVCLPDVL